MKPKNQPVVNLITGWQPSPPQAGGWTVGCWKIVAISVSTRKVKVSCWGLSAVLGFFLSLLWPTITSLATIRPLLSQPTGRSEDPPQYWCCYVVSLWWFSQPPMLMNLCSIFRSFFVAIMPYHIFILWSWWFCLLLAPLWFHCLHILCCHLFLAIDLCTDPALNYLVYN